jgi:hypothetical protein
MTLREMSTPRQASTTVLSPNFMSMRSMLSVAGAPCSFQRSRPGMITPYGPGSAQTSLIGVIEFEVSPTRNALPFALLSFVGFVVKLGTRTSFFFALVPEDFVPGIKFA